MSIRKKTAQVLADLEITKRYNNHAVSQKGRVYSDFDKLKRRIYKEFPKKRLIGDIAINDKEFMILIEYLQTFYKYLRILDWEICSDPIVCVAMVQIGIRYYDGGYWPHFKKIIDSPSWNINRQAVMGKVCLETLKQYNKYVLEENDRINTILLHGFVSNKYAYKLMDFLYAYYRIDLERDLSRNDRDMMRELIRSIQNKDNTNRTYKLVQQTSDAVLCNARGCNIRLRWLLRLIDSTFWGEEVRINPANRLSRIFGEWADQSKELQQNRGGVGVRQRVFSSPHITFNNKNGQFNILLPSQLVKTDQDISWYCIINGKENRILTEAIESVLAYKTETVVTSVMPMDIFGRLSLNLEYGEVKKRFVIPEERVRFFTKEGASVSVGSMREGEYYAFSQSDNAITSTALVEKRRYEGLWFYYLVCESGDIIKTADGKTVSIGRKAEEGLMTKGIVPGVVSSKDKLPVYNKIPSLLIKIPKSKLQGTAVSINGQKTRLQDSCALTEIQLDDGSDNIGYWFSAADLGCDHDGE